MTKRFIAEVWAAKLLDQFKAKTVMDEIVFPTPQLDRHDVWAPSGETFEEAVAWARLLGVRVAKPKMGLGPMSDNFMITRPGCVPVWIPQCSPSELIETMKSYAESTAQEAAPDRTHTIVVNAPAARSPARRAG